MDKNPGKLNYNTTLNVSDVMAEKIMNVNISKQKKQHPLHKLNSMKISLGITLTHYNKFILYHNFAYIFNTLCWNINIFLSKQRNVSAIYHSEQKKLIYVWRFSSIIEILHKIQFSTKFLFVLFSKWGNKCILACLSQPAAKVFSNSFCNIRLSRYNKLLAAILHFPIIKELFVHNANILYSKHEL